MQQLLDIHSHILPAVDDGAKDLETSLALLEAMHKQGITHIVATPHFYATEDNFEAFIEKRRDAYNTLSDALQDRRLPKTYLGAEVHYFRGIQRSEDIRALCLGNSDYLLLELPNREIDREILAAIVGLSENLGMIPILAHVERYSREKGYKELLRLIADGGAYAQINCESVFKKSPFFKTATMLMKKELVSFLATDAHSLDRRPPLMRQALQEVADVFSPELAERFSANSQSLLNILQGRPV